MGPIDSRACFLPSLGKGFGGVPIQFLLLRRDKAYQGKAVFFLLCLKKRVGAGGRPSDAPLCGFLSDRLGTAVQTFRRCRIKTLSHIKGRLEGCFRLPGKPVVDAGCDDTVGCQKHDDCRNQRKRNKDNDKAGTDLGAENFSAPLHDQLYDIPGDKEQDDEHEDGVDVQQGDEHP